VDHNKDSAEANLNITDEEKHLLKVLGKYIKIVLI